MTFYPCFRFRFPVGVVAGAIVGGLVAVAAIVCAFLYLRRRPPMPTAFGIQPNVATSDPHNTKSQTPQPNMTHVSTSPTRSLSRPIPLVSRPASQEDITALDQLTNEQAAYVQNMYSLNVPAPAIALVVERMVQEGETRAGESSTGSAVVRRGNSAATMPPSYYVD